MTTSRAAATGPVPDHVDVLIVGAGIAGISAAHHLRSRHPQRSFAIADSRDAIGGTWDLFRYPGIRSDSDMQTYGFGFKPWRSRNAIADADEILQYLEEAVDESGLRPHIHLGHKVVSADFSTAAQRWRVVLEQRADGRLVEVTATMLFSGAGYYDTDTGFAPEFPGSDDFTGQVIHPQHWPEGLDHSGKKVVVIGSGATAVTLVPAVAQTAEHVTMLQRSPSYVVPIPRKDPIANTLRRILPAALAYSVTRAVNIRKASLLYKGSRRCPRLVRFLVRKVTAASLPEGFDVDTHFNPAYDPWDQRMCMVPDGDFFTAITHGAASVVTDRIACFTENGIRLESGSEIEADIVVTATGLEMVPFGKIALAVDGQQVHLPDHVTYKGLMVSGIPNFVFTIGYINNSWTLKADLVASWFCRLLAYLDDRGHVGVVPTPSDTSMQVKPLIEFDAGYITRAMHRFPKQGTCGPWTAPQDFTLDRVRLEEDPIVDTELRFRGVSREVQPQ